MNKNLKKVILALLVGACLVPMPSVKADDEKPATQDYVASTDTTLKTLTIEGVTLNPAFDPEVTEYTGTIDADVKDILIDANPSYPYATVDGDGKKTLSDEKTSFDFKVTVTSEDWSTKDYTIHLTRNIIEDLSISLTGNQMTFVEGEIDHNKVPKGFIPTPMTYQDREIQVYTNSTFPFSLVYLEDATKKQDWYCFDSGSVSSVFRTLVINNNTYYYAGVPKKIQKQKGFSYGDIVVLGDRLKGWHVNDSGHKNEMMLYLYDMNGKADYYIFNSENSTLINRAEFEVNKDKAEKNFFTTPLFAAILMIVIGTISFGYVFLASSRHDTIKEGWLDVRNYFKQSKKERKKVKDDTVEIVRTNKKRVYPEHVLTTENEVEEEIKQEPKPTLQAHLYEEPDIFKAALNHLNTTEYHPSEFEMPKPKEEPVKQVEAPVTKPKKGSVLSKFKAKPLPEKEETVIPERFTKKEPEEPVVVVEQEEIPTLTPPPTPIFPTEEEVQPIYDNHDYMNEIYDYIDTLFYKEK